MTISPQGFSVVLLSASLVLLAGCSSPATRFYVLSARPTQAPMNLGQEVAIGVGPVELPDYLDRPQIVTRSGQNELKLADFDHWGESLKDNTTEVLAENLAALLGSKKISLYPWKRSTWVNYQVTVKIIRFDRTETGETVLFTRWSILNNEGKEVYSHESRYSENASGQGYANTVAAMDQVLAQFSREVATAIYALKSNGLPLP